jgi:hypothetical protein
MTRPMPQIDLDAHDECRMALVALAYEFTNPVTGTIERVNGLDVARATIATQGKNRGCLRAAKPPIATQIIQRERHGYSGNYYTMTLAEGAAAQVWRWVAFYASSNGQHHSIPVMAEFDAPFDMTTDDLRSFSKWCQQVTDTVLKIIPIEQQTGLRRWANVL